LNFVELEILRILRMKLTICLKPAHSLSAEATPPAYRQAGTPLGRDGHGAAPSTEPMALSMSKGLPGNIISLMRTFLRAPPTIRAGRYPLSHYGGTGHVPAGKDK
jgi:hypothetical protein